MSDAETERREHNFVPSCLSSWPFTDPFRAFSNPLEFLHRLIFYPLDRYFSPFLEIFSPFPTLGRALSILPQPLSGPSWICFCLFALRGYLFWSCQANRTSEIASSPHRRYTASTCYSSLAVDPHGGRLESNDRRRPENLSPSPGKAARYHARFRIRAKAELACRINQLKGDLGAVILGHNYMEPGLFHSVPDFTGDSLELSRLAATTDGDPIVFCGVHFMAETAKILSPHKTVLIPSLKAGCSLAASITAEDVRNLRKRFPGVPVVTYVNTYADIKAESDICCTSSNALAVIESLKTETAIFLPDEYLARNVARESGKHIIFPTDTPIPRDKQDPHMEYHLIGWHGKCEVHEKFKVDDVENVRRQFPDVIVLAHPECSPEVVAAADFSGSTSAMIRFVEESRAPRYLLLTECSMADNVAAENPDKEMLRLCSVRCPHMNQITLQDTLDSLLQNRYVVDVPEEVRLRAKRAVDRMLEIH